MSYNLVDPTTGDLTRVAGGTLYADLPIGSWVKNDMGTLPSGFLKEGDTISQSEYPELYAKYGSTVPYKADTSELSEYEEITLPTTAATAMTMPYDGVYILANYGVSYIHHIYLNGIEISAGTTGNNTTGASTSSTILFKKGDTMYRLNTYTGSTFTEHVAYYKKSLIVKAKHVGIPADFIDAVDDAISDTTVDTVADGNMNPVTSNAVYDALANINGSTSVIWGSSRTISVTKGGGWWGLIPPDVPSSKYILRYIAYVSSPNNNVRVSLAYGSEANGKPSSVIIYSDEEVSGVEIKIGAVVRDK